MDVRHIVGLLQVLLPLLYAALVAVYGITFFRSAPGLEKIKHPALIVIIVLHLGYLGARTMLFDHPPITSLFEIMTLLAACIGGAYLYLEFRTRVLQCLA